MPFLNYSISMCLYDSSILLNFSVLCRSMQSRVGSTMPLQSAVASITPTMSPINQIYRYENPLKLHKGKPTKACEIVNAKLIWLPEITANLRPMQTKTAMKKYLAPLLVINENGPVAYRMKKIRMNTPIAQLSINLKMNPTPYS